MANNQYKNCPYCDEEIKYKAIKCKHCHSFLKQEKDEARDGQAPLSINQNNIGSHDSLLKQCPHCFNDIPKKALLCRFCDLSVESNYPVDKMNEVQKDVPNGRQGEIVSGGEKYIGQKKDGKRHGKGVQVWPDGDKYEGEFIDDRFFGWGSYTWASGDKYVGKWKNDLKHGEGTFYYSNGITEEGYWLNDKYVGRSFSKRPFSLNIVVLLLFFMSISTVVSTVASIVGSSISNYSTSSPTLLLFLIPPLLISFLPGIIGVGLLMRLRYAYISSIVLFSLGIMPLFYAVIIDNTMISYAIPFLFLSIPVLFVLLSKKVRNHFK